MTIARWGRIPALASAALLSGCFSNANEQTEIEAKKAKVDVSFFDAGTMVATAAIEAASGGRDAAFIKGQCPARAGKVDTEALGAILVWLAGQGISYVIGKIDDRLQDELKKYTATFEGSASQQFYVDQPQPILAFPCFRMARSYVAKAGNEDKTRVVAMDFIGKMEVEGNRRLKITPLRLYVAETAAETKKGGAVGISVGVKTDSIWRDISRGRQEAGTVDVKVLTEKVVPERGVFYQAYALPRAGAMSGKGIAPAVIAPLPPWSYYSGAPQPDGQTTLTVSVAEAGEIPWLLEKAANLFHDNKDKIVDQLKDAAKKAIEKDE